MNRNLHLLSEFGMFYIKNRITSKILGCAFLLYGSFASAQYKIDPRFQNLIDQTTQNKFSKKSVEKMNEENHFTTSTIILPNGTTQELYHAIIHTDSPEKLKNDGFIIQSISKGFVTALVSVDDLQKLSNDNNVKEVSVPSLDYVTNDINVTESGAALLHSGVLNNTNYTGKGVLVGIYDTGIDYKHPDFSNPNDITKTRILKIWDQTITPAVGESSPNLFATGNYGVEYTQAQINDEIDGTPANFIRQTDTNGHGTHVAGTAAGSGLGFEKLLYKGAAPEADIVVVKGGNSSFSTTNTINALEYFKKISEDLNKPIVVNMSIGGQSSPHDGSGSHETKVNEFTSSGPGRVVVISAGNEGSGNIHQRIDLAPGEKKTITLKALATSATTKTLFSFLTYNKGNNNSKEVTVKLTAPDGTIYTQVPGGENTSSYTKGTGTISMNLRNYNSSAYGKRFTEFIVSRSDSSVATDDTYILEYENTSTENLTLDGWIYSNDISVSLPNGDNYYTVGSPGTATNALTVANHIGRTFMLNRTSGSYSYSNSASYITQNLNPSSSKGPRADEVRKPEISADGTNVASALSSSTTTTAVIDGKYYTYKTGTSMSSPGVTGAVALLLQANNKLTYADVKKRITENATKDQFTTNNFTNEFGYGKLNIYQAVADELNNLNNNSSCPISKFTTLGYDDIANSYTSTNLPSSYSGYFGDNNGPNYGRVAVKYKSNIVGKLGSLFVQVAHNLDVTKAIPFLVNVRKVNADGNPGDIIGTKNYDDFNKYYAYEWANFDLSDLNIKVANNEEFFLEIYSPVRSLRLFFDKTNIDKRTYASIDSGVSYNVVTTLDAKMRAIVYENDPAVKQLATTSKNASQNVTLGNTYFVNGCELITKVESSGASPITGKTTAKAWIDSTLKDFVQRRIEINADINNSTSTGKVTLFYTQADFDLFNQTATKKLPTSSTDDANKKNIVVHYYAGISKDNTGKPESYSNAVINTPVAADKIVWNDTYKYWEITIDAIGFGGYLLSTNETLANIENSLNLLSVYPNPVINELSINLPSDVKEAKINIVDISGRNVVNTEIKQANNKVNVSHLAKGVYIVEIKIDKGSITKKIIKN
jgi:minor extracellular serine protease Vpr